MQKELEQGFHRAYPSNLRVNDRAGRPLYFHYSAGRRFWVGSHKLVAGRTLFGCFWNQNGERVGTIQLHEWHPGLLVPNDDFFWAMDERDDETCAVAKVLIEAWDIQELIEAGPILEFSSLWMHPDHSKGSVWAPALEALIRRRYRNRFSVMVLKAFPIEYSGAVPGGSPLEKGFVSRSRAMQRLHARVIGAASLPGELGDCGWMWRPLSDGAPQPERAKEGRGGLTIRIHAAAL